MQPLKIPSCNKQVIFLVFLFVIFSCKSRSTQNPKVINEINETSKKSEESNRSLQEEDSTKSKEEASPNHVKEIFWNQVAGSFYPSDSETIKSMISDYLQKAKKLSELEKRDLVGMTAPHAGYQYSGPVAAWGYKQIEGRNISTVVILGFSHHGFYPYSAVLPYDSYRTPLGTVPVDTELRDKLVEKGKGIIVANKTPFMGEHSMEVHIPFIQTVLPQARILPIAVEGRGGKIDEGLAKLLFETIGGRKDIFVVASTDLSHYTPYEDANQTDKETLKWITEMNLQKIVEEGPGANRMCGYYPVGVLLNFFSLYNNKDKKGTMVYYANSGDTSGDKTRGVVGYGVVMFSLPPGTRTGEVTQGEKEKFSALLTNYKDLINSIAKKSIEDAILGKETEIPEIKEEVLKQKMGSIVNIYLDGRIYGTGAELSFELPFFRSVIESARKTILSDSRYPTPSPDRVGEIEVEVYAISNIQQIEDFQVETLEGDGIIVKGKKGEGIVFPQEMDKMGWNKEEALQMGCRRANLGVDCYKQNNFRAEGLKLEVLKGEKI